MSRSVHVYIEGGAPGRAADNDFRRGWKKFLERLHRHARDCGYDGLNPIRGKGRSETFRRFKQDIEANRSDLCVLLVDSEGPVHGNQNVWEVVFNRDGWRKPDGATSSHLYLMVQMVEAWLLSDHDALEKYFKGGLNRKNLPKTNLEQRSKDEVNNALIAATRDSQRGAYRHGQAHEILEFVKPEYVMTLTHGHRLFDTLAKLIKDNG